MIVQCLAASGDALAAVSLDEKTGMTVDAEFPLTVGRSYVVYAFAVFDGRSCFYVLDDDERDYPIWYPADLFSIADPQIPDDWVFGYIEAQDGDAGYPVISFPEWALDRRFYEEWVDGSASAAEIFARRRLSAENPTVRM
jgi:hypothetical protein